jgi:hypothetical protein
MGKIGRTFLRLFPSLDRLIPFTIWTRDRNLPKAPKESFSEWFAKQQKNEQ